jgi:uncharacterized membrane protein YdjX (TVP38/TMEM64 family)
MMRFIPHILSLFLLALAIYASTQSNIVLFLESQMEGAVFGGVFFIAALVLAVVLAPLAALPLIPLAAALFGPLLTSLYSVIGWTVGGMIAFLIARYAGRPLLARFVSLNEMARYEHMVPQKMIFVSLVLLRMIIPVDVLSYAIGFLSTVSFATYTLATLIGVIPFSFIFAYGSGALATQQFVVLGALFVLACCIFWIALSVLRRARVED